MRQLHLIILFLLIGTISHGQESDFDLKNIKFKGIEFSTTKKAIINSFGEGKRVETNYECGFFTNDQKAGPYYQLVYSNFNYIGSDKEKFFYLQNVDFDAKGTTKIEYLEKELTGKTTEEEFVKMFGEEVKNNFVNHGDHNTFLLYSKGSDDAAVFSFKDGRLFKFACGARFKFLVLSFNQRLVSWDSLLSLNPQRHIHKRYRQVNNMNRITILLIYALGLLKFQCKSHAEFDDVTDYEWKYESGFNVGDWLKFQDGTYQFKNNTIFFQDSALAKVTRLERSVILNEWELEISSFDGRRGDYISK